jgi:hypothetical protein
VATRFVPWRNPYGMVVAPRIHEPYRQCRFCASFWGFSTVGTGTYKIDFKHAVACEPTECLACGARQCMSNGLGDGHCKVCYVGWLRGCSGSRGTCQRARCNEPHVGTVRKRNVCAAHIGEVRRHDRIMVEIDEDTMRAVA